MPQPLEETDVASMALLMQNVWSMSFRRRRLVECASGLFLVCLVLAGCATSHVAQSHLAQPAQPTVHAAAGAGVHSSGGSAQGVANLIFLAAQLVGFLSTASDDCADVASDAVVEAMVAQGRVWTLRASGTVCSLADGESTPHAEALPEQALALCPRNGTVAVLTAKDDTGGAWTFRQLDNGAWRRQMTFDGGHDRFVALDCALERVTLLTSKRLLLAEDGAMRTVPLSAEIPSGFATLQVGGDEAYVTVDNGELEREFLRVDLQDGAVASAVARETAVPEGDVSADLPWSQLAPQF